MTPRPAPSLAERAPFRALIGRLASVTDSQMLRILATVETAADRREADALLSPLRPRLNVLRPPRRLRMQRLLFYPFDPLILPPRTWRPGMPALPRSVLLPIASAVAAAIPETIAAVEAQIDGQTSADKDLIRIAGSQLWPAAARAIDPLQPPTGWRETGMAATHHRKLAPVIAAVLRQAGAIEALCQTSLPGLLPPPQDAVQAVIRAVASEHAPALPWLFGILLMRLPEPAVSLASGRPDPNDRIVAQARESAADLLLARLDVGGPAAWISGGDLIESAGMVRRLLHLLTELDRVGGAGRRALCRTLRQRLDQAAQARFETSLRNDLLVKLAKTPRQDPHVLEDAAYSLRIFQLEAREVGGRSCYDTALAEAATYLSRVAEDRMTRLRLTEILLGTEAGLAQLRV